MGKRLCLSMFFRLVVAKILVNMFRTISLSTFCRNNVFVTINSEKYILKSKIYSTAIRLKRYYPLIVHKTIVHNIKGNITQYPIHFLHINCRDYAKHEKNSFSLNDFLTTEIKNKRTFLEAIYQYEHNYPNRKGHLEFISSALKKMVQFGVQDDLEVYKKLINVFPKGPFIPKNDWQAAMRPYSSQQYLAIDVMEQMEYHGIIPDVEFGEAILDVFGRKSDVFVKFDNYMYWCIKFKNKNPWWLPKQVPCDPLLLAKMAVQQMISVDIQSEVTVFQTKQLSESIDNTWIVSGQSLKQKELLANHGHALPVVVEGGDQIWLRNKSLTYFVLKSDFIDEHTNHYNNRDDLLKMQTKYFNPNYIEEVNNGSLNVHQQQGGTIYAICVTGTSSKDSLLSWVRLLQNNGNPILGEVPVLFRLMKYDQSPVTLDDGKIQETQLIKD